MQRKLNWKAHFVELAIVIIGISVAFWLNSLASNRKDRQLEQEFIADLRTELRIDSVRLDYQIRFNERKVASLVKGMAMLDRDRTMANVDSALFYTNQIGHYDFFFPENFTLISMLESGDIKLIRSKEIKKELIRLQRKYDYIDWVQNNFLKALDDNFFPMLMKKVDMQSGFVNDPAFLYSTENRNYIGFALSDTKTHLEQYKLAVAQIEKLLGLMADV